MMMATSGDWNPAAKSQESYIIEGSFHTVWVKRRNSRCEQMLSAVLPTADIQPCHRQGMSKAYRVTLQIPAWVTVSATARLDPAVNGTTLPSAPATKRST